MRGELDTSDPDRPVAEKDPGDQVPYSIDFGPRFAAWGRTVASVVWAPEPGSTLTVLQQQLVSGVATALIGGGTLDNDETVTAVATSDGAPPIVLEQSIRLKIRSF